jgi:hypothetical protein
MSWCNYHTAAKERWPEQKQVESGAPGKQSKEKRIAA